MDVRDAFEGSGPYGGNNPNSSVTAIIDNFFEFNISGTVHKGYYHDADQIMMGDASAAAAANDDAAYESRRNTIVASRMSQRQCRVMLHTQGTRPYLQTARRRTRRAVRATPTTAPATT